MFYSNYFLKISHKNLELIKKNYQTSLMDNPSDQSTLNQNVNITIKILKLEKIDVI